MSTKSKSKANTAQEPKRKWKILVIDPRRCVGCEICESVCSFAHDKEFNPINSRINRVRIEPIINSTISCLKCKDPDCVDACELNALSQDMETGNIIVDEDVCNGCGACIRACPYGAITIHSTKSHALFCDECKSTDYDEPQCVEYCPKEAIFIEEIDPDEDDDRMQTLKRILKRGFEGDGMLN